jgi:hypothetical protein
MEMFEGNRKNRILVLGASGLTGGEIASLREWAPRHREALLAAASKRSSPNRRKGEPTRLIMRIRQLYHHWRLVRRIAPSRRLKLNRRCTHQVMIVAN